MPYKTFHKNGLFTTVEDGAPAPLDFTDAFAVSDVEAELIKSGAALYVVDMQLQIVPELLAATAYEPSSGTGEILEGEVLP